MNSDRRNADIQRTVRFLGMAAFAISLAGVPINDVAAGEAAKAVTFNITSTDLAGALNQFAQQSDQQIVFATNVTSGKSVRPLQGAYEPRKALDAILEGSGLKYRVNANKTILISSAGISSEQTSEMYEPQAPPANPTRAAAATMTKSDAAANQSEAPSFAIEEVVVTAQKRAENINDVGMSINAFSGESLIQRGVADVSDLSKVVPGFVYTKGSYGAPVYTIRGVGFFDTTLGAAPTVSVYVDEVSIPYPVMTSGVVLDLERVEVLKGPQGIYYGQNSTGGSINYIAAKPKDVFGAATDISYGRFDKSEIRGYLTGPLSDTLRARVAWRYDHLSDWQKSYTRNDDGGETNLFVGRILLDWTPTDELKVAVNINGWRDRSENQFGQLVEIGGNTAPLTPALRNYLLAPKTSRAADWDPSGDFSRDQDFYQYALRADYELSADSTLTSITSYQDFNRDSVVDADGTAFMNFTISNPGRIRSFSQELRVSGQVNENIRFIVGGNYQSDRIVESSNAYAPDSSFPFDGADAPGRQRAHTGAAFGNIDWKPIDDLTVQAGLRYTEQKRSYVGCLRDQGGGDVSTFIAGLARRLGGKTVVIAPGACATLAADFTPGDVHLSLKENNVSWRFGFNYEPVNQTLLYANVGRGYKNGTFPVLGATFAEQFQPATQESVLAYEAGFKQGFLDRRIQANGAGFYYDYTDKQIRGSRIDPVLGRVNRLLNIPKSRIYGAELQIDILPAEGLKLSMGGTLVDSKILGNFTNVTALGATKLLSGERFPLTPKWQFTFDGSYDFPLTDQLNGFLGAGLSHQSSTNSGLGEHPILDIDSYTLADARAGLRADDESWNMSFFVRNLTNKYYWSFTNYQGQNARFRYAGLPRMWGISLGFHY